MVQVVTTWFILNQMATRRSVGSVTLPQKKACRMSCQGQAAEAFAEYNRKAVATLEALRIRK